MSSESNLTRRHFLRSAGLGTVLLGGSASRSALGPQHGPEHRQATVDTTKRMLFFDDAMIESLKSTRFALNPAVKVSNNPVIISDRPWEGKTIAEATVFYDEDLKLFRMWYPVYDYHPPTPPVEQPVSQNELGVADIARARKRCTACYAISEDGYHWEKPSLGLVEFQGSKANNILMASSMKSRAHFSTGHLFRDPVEEDPDKKYKGLKSNMLRGQDGQERMTLDLFYSGDGFNWTPYEGNPVYDLKRPGTWGPTSFMGWDPIGKVYAVYMENCGHQKCPVGKRLIGRAESPDMIHWSQSETILVPDEEDGPDTELYAMHPCVYEEFYVGMLWMFNKTQQTHYPQFVFGRDGIRFDRRYREPFILPGPTPEFDSNSILPLKPIVYKDEIFVYYIGANYRTRQQFDVLGEEKAQWSIGLAVLPRDRFVCLEGEEGKRGEIVTHTLRLSGSRLHVNMEVVGAAPGDLKVEVVDPAYFPLPGHTLKDADALPRSGLDNVVTWNGNPDVSGLAGRPIKLRFYLRNVRLFSFRVLSAERE